jgi:hypothetical protein
MPGDFGGELQTLISTLQNGNVQLGHIVERLDKLYSLGPGRAVAATGPLSVEPEGYFTFDVPGVGPRLVAYYPAP